MKNLLIILAFMLSFFPAYSQSSNVDVGLEAALQHTFEKSSEVKSYLTMEVCGIVKGEWGFSLVTNSTIVEPVFFIKNKFIVVTQDGFSVYVIPFWYYGYISKGIGRDIFNSLEVDYRIKDVIITLGTDWKWTRNYDYFNSDVGINLTLKYKFI